MKTKRAILKILTKTDDTRKRTSKPNFEIYPNPAKNNFNIEIPEYLVSDEDLDEAIIVEVYDFASRKIQEDKIPAAQRNYRIFLENSKFNSGVYTIILKHKTMTSIIQYIGTSPLRPP